MKLALTRKCKIPDERATAITKLIMDVARGEAEKRKGAVPLDAITFGFVVRDIGDNITEETDLARIEGYIRDKLPARFNEIEAETAAKRRDEVAIALETFQTQLAAMTAERAEDRAALAQLQETVADLLQKGEAGEQSLQQLASQNAQMQEAINGLLKALEEEKEARLVLEGKVGKAEVGAPPVGAPSDIPSTTSPQPSQAEIPMPRADLVVSTKKKK